MHIDKNVLVRIKDSDEALTTYIALHNELDAATTALLAFYKDFFHMSPEYADFDEDAFSELLVNYNAACHKLDDFQQALADG